MTTQIAPRVRVALRNRTADHGDRHQSHLLLSALSLSGPCPPRERIQELARCLRVVEQQFSGLRRERWGYAAANAEAAAAAAHPLVLRWLWATACDYARHAAEGSANAPVHPMRWSSRTSG